MTGGLFNARERSVGRDGFFALLVVHSEPDDAQHEYGEHGDIQQCVNHTPLPLADSDPTRARKIPSGSRHWSGKIKLRPRGDRETAAPRSHHINCVLQMWLGQSCAALAGRCVLNYSRQK